MASGTPSGWMLALAPPDGARDCRVSAGRGNVDAFVPTGSGCSPASEDNGLGVPAASPGPRALRGYRTLRLDSRAVGLIRQYGGHYGDQRARLCGDIRTSWPLAAGVQPVRPAGF